MNKNLFGTDGIRARVGTAPITRRSLPLLGKAIGFWICKNYTTSGRILIACDTRDSSNWIIGSLLEGLLLHPLTIHLTGILPTPAICNLLKQIPFFDCGIVVSASHNPYYDNGIKILDPFKGKLSCDDEKTISQIYYDPASIKNVPYGTLRYFKQADNTYVNDIISRFYPSFLNGIKIVLDCAHGATYKIAPPIFKALGADVVIINASPNGTNINKNCGSVHIDALRDAVHKHAATIGFAFDGDGDRVTVVNHNGVIKNGDDMLALLSNHRAYTKEQTIVGTVMSNLGLDAYFKDAGKTLIRTNVGDKYIADYLNTHTLLLGGEQSGHIILHDYLPTGDGIFTALRLCETMIESRN